MKIHHLNCGSMCPSKIKFGNIFGPLSGIVPDNIVCHCLLIEAQNNLILVDTGIGREDLKFQKLIQPVSLLLGVKADKQLTAYEQVKKLGYSPEDVTDLILTHLDFDHAGGIADFKSAKVHVAKPELESARSGRSPLEKGRYRKYQFSSAIKWQEFEMNFGEPWNGFETVREIQGLPPEILLVQLPGHSKGHFGIAVQMSDKCLLHAGDSYYDRRELNSTAIPPLWTMAVERIANSNFVQSQKTKSHLASLSLNPRIELFCSHDSKELDRFKLIQA